MSGFIGVYNLLKEQRHEFVVITARGGFVKEMKDDAIRLLEENNIKFDKYYWKVEDKLEICKNEKVDIMIDDDWKIIKKLADNQVKTLYFRDTNLIKLEERGDNNKDTAKAPKEKSSSKKKEKVRGRKLKK